MGYYSTIEANIYLSDNVEPEEFYRAMKETPFEEDNIYFDRIEDKDYIELDETVVKIYDRRYVVEQLSHYVEGEITVYGEENTDIWKAEFYGGGNYTIYKGIIEFVPEVIER